MFNHRYASFLSQNILDRPGVASGDQAAAAVEWLLFSRVVARHPEMIDKARSVAGHSCGMSTRTAESEDRLPRPSYVGIINVTHSEEDMAFMHGHALVIGIGNYMHIPRWNLPVTARDATEVAAVLTDPDFCGYPTTQVRLLRQAETTRERVLKEIERLASVVDEDHTMVLFYCGHGAYSDDGSYHLSTHDTRLTSSGKIEAGSAISHQELILRLQQIRAKRVLLIFNACHAGTISPTLSADGAIETGHAVPASTTSALLATGTGRIIVTACREDQLSYVGNGPLTRFTQALVDGLHGRGDVTSRNGYISAYDLYLHTYFTVYERGERNGQPQEPELTVLKGIGPFAVALYRSATTLSGFDSTEPPPAEGAVREVRPERSRAALHIIMSQIAGRDAVGGNQVQAGRDAAGRDINRINTAGGTFIDGGVFTGGGDFIGRDKTVHGDEVRGDKSDVRNWQGVINPSGRVHQNFGKQRTINTGGGDYAEGNIDKRSGAFVSGGTVYGPVVGSNSGTIMNIKSTLSDVTQMIGASDHADANVKGELLQLTEQLANLLQQAPPERVQDVAKVTKRVKALVEAATNADVDHELVVFNIQRLEKDTPALIDELPPIQLLCNRIAGLASRIAGIA